MWATSPSTSGGGDLRKVRDYPIAKIRSAPKSGKPHARRQAHTNTSPPKCRGPGGQARRRNASDRVRGGFLSGY
ncbi:unnamed protein product [Arctogadus glacialis]